MSLDAIRTMQAQFRERCAKLVLRGTGDPDPAMGTPGMMYIDTSSVPATVWIRQRSGWVKASPGATE